MALKQRPPVPAPHDASYKALLCHAAVIESLFVHLAEALGLPLEIAKFWDISKAELVSSESFSRKLKKRFNDIIIRIPAFCIPLFDGIPLAEDLHVVVELQSRPEPKMPERMMRYLKSVFRRLWIRAKRKGVVPQLLCIVLYHGEPPWPGPRVPLVSIYDNNRPGRQIPGTHPEHRVNMQTLDVTGMPEDALFPALCRIEQAEDIDRVRSVLKAVFTKHSGLEDDALCEALYNRVITIGWFWDSKTENHVPYKEARRAILGEIPMPDIVTKVDRITFNQGLQEGLQKGLQEGLQKGQRRQLCRQAARKFNGRAAKRLDTLLKTINDDDVLAKIGDAIIDCNTRKEFIDVCKGLSDPH